MKLSKLIKKLQALQKKHGDLDVYYASDYDWALEIRSTDVTVNPGWDGAPKKKAVYLS